MKEGDNLITSTFWHIIGWSFGICSTIGFFLIIITEWKEKEEYPYKFIYFITAVLGWAVAFGVK